MVVDRNIYGTREMNGLENGAEYHTVPVAGKVYWTEPGLKITRLRLLSDPGFPAWDVSYCHGELNGQRVEVELPFSQLSKFGYRKEIVEYAKREKVFAKGLGIFGAISTLN